MGKYRMKYRLVLETPWNGRHNKWESSLRRRAPVLVLLCLSSLEASLGGRHCRSKSQSAMLSRFLASELSIVGRFKYNKRST